MIEQFLLALLPEDGYVFLKSEGVNNLLSDASIRYLRQAQDSGVYWLPVEQVIAYQHIEQVKDGIGRDGIWNHTLLVPIGDYLRLSKPDKLLADHVLHKKDKAPERLEPITT